MSSLESIEGADGIWTYHYDVPGDVLYLRKADAMEIETWAEETDDGFMLLRSVSDDRPVGLTIVSWWKRFGSGTIPESEPLLRKRIVQWSEQHPVAA